MFFLILGFIAFFLALAGGFYLEGATEEPPTESTEILTGVAIISLTLSCLSAKAALFFVPRERGEAPSNAIVYAGIIASAIPYPKFLRR